MFRKSARERFGDVGDVPRDWVGQQHCQRRVAGLLLIRLFRRNTLLQRVCRQTRDGDGVDWASELAREEAVVCGDANRHVFAWVIDKHPPRASPSQCDRLLPGGFHDRSRRIKERPRTETEPAGRGRWFHHRRDHALGVGVAPTV